MRQERLSAMLTQLATIAYIFRLCSICWLWLLLPDFQGQGHGRALMQAVREEGSAAGYAGIRINSGISRTEAHEFYRKLGCEEKADQKRFYWEF